jgi:hypothetical protein
MCNGGSSNPIKDPLYWLVKQDSRAAAEVGRGLGLDFLRDEGKYNQKNPGHAITKAAEYAALYGLGDYFLGAGSATEGGMDAVQAGENVGSMGPLAANAAGGATMTAEQLAEQQAMQQLAQQAPQGLGNTMEAGMMDTGYTPSSLWHALNNPNATATSAANRTLGTTLSGGGGGGSTSKLMAAQQGLKMMFPQQPQYQPPPQRQFQGQQEPLPTMYGRNQGPYGTAAGNSVGFTEEQKKKLRDMGYKI